MSKQLKRISLFLVTGCLITVTSYFKSNNVNVTFPVSAEAGSTCLEQIPPTTKLVTQRLSEQHGFPFYFYNKSYSYGNPRVNNCGPAAVNWTDKHSKTSFEVNGFLADISVWTITVGALLTAVGLLREQGIKR